MKFPEMDTGGRREQPRSSWALSGLSLLALMLFAGFAALGTWQLERRVWKLDLIERVAQRLHAAPAAAPGRAQWPAINAHDDEYRRLFADGVFLDDRETLVQAVTERGAGFWVVTPLRSDAGFIVLVNRGFVDAAHRTPASRDVDRRNDAGHVVGLLRMSEPRGAFLRRNDAATDRWYSRDVAAIAAARGLPAADVAPYFIDADATANPGGWPVGGLTVVHFRNSHFGYALTWYALALLVAAAAFTVGRHEWRLRHARHHRQSLD
ncbi:MAG TPA: SURF1 family protein [Solimonas sp.]|nr:SURF1 family protein [Solimonas sp.]